MSMKILQSLALAALVLGFSQGSVNALSNPAADYCASDEVRGEVLEDGKCKLPGGEVVEQWAYYNEKHPS